MRFRAAQQAEKQAIKIPKGILKSSPDIPSPDPPQFPLHVPLSQPPPHLFVSIVSTKPPIQAPMTSLKAGSGRLSQQWSHGNKRQFMKPERRRDGGRRGERVALGLPMRLDAHLVAMCDRSSGANDGLPEASSIRPGLAGLPASGTKRDAYRHVAAPFVCLWVSVVSCRILPRYGNGWTWGCGL